MFAANHPTSPAPLPDSPAAAAISVVAASRASAFLEESITVAPLSANREAIAFPIPRLAPVTSATLPSRRISTVEPYGPSIETASTSTHSQETMNRLASEPSPYLRQHAENPVDWYPWAPEAFDRARSSTALSCSRSATRLATGATSWRTSPSRTR